MIQYKIKVTNKFKKKLKQIQKQAYFNYNSLYEVINMHASNIILPRKYKNHLLKPKKNRHMGMPCATRYIVRILKIR